MRSGQYADLNRFVKRLQITNIFNKINSATYTYTRDPDILLINVRVTLLLYIYPLLSDLSIPPDIRYVYTLCIDVRKRL